jgi:hypothetical protein
MKSKQFNALRRSIGSKPEHFQGSEKQWGRLIAALLTPPDHTKMWVKVEKKNSKGKVYSSHWERV